MQQNTTRVNPSEETIKIGPVGIRFLVTGEDSQGQRIRVRNPRASGAEVGRPGAQE